MLMTPEQLESMGFSLLGTSHLYIMHCILCGSAAVTLNQTSPSSVQGKKCTASSPPTLYICQTIAERHLHPQSLSWRREQIATQRDQSVRDSDQDTGERQITGRQTHPECLMIQSYSPFSPQALISILKPTRCIDQTKRKRQRPPLSALNCFRRRLVYRRSTPAFFTLIYSPSEQTSSYQFTTR